MSVARVTLECKGERVVLYNQTHTHSIVVCIGFGATSYTTRLCNQSSMLPATAYTVQI